MIELLNIDCMEYMATLPDNAFDLAVVDPPYGIGFSDYERGSMGIKIKERHTKNGKKQWDNNGVPTDEYFKELKRVSVNQIVWGGNYFPILWEGACKGFIFWYKQNPVDNFADGELAWTSFDRLPKCFNYRYYGSLDGKTSATEKIHPTQKPIQLYMWLLHNYASPGDRILDTHGGSMSSAIAAHDMGFDMVLYELDKDYYDAGVKRYNNAIKQLKLL